MTLKSYKLDTKAKQRITSITLYHSLVIAKPYIVIETRSEQIANYFLWSLNMDTQCSLECKERARFQQSINGKCITITGDGLTVAMQIVLGTPTTAESAKLLNEIRIDITKAFEAYYNNPLKALTLSFFKAINFNGIKQSLSSNFFIEETEALIKKKNN